MTLLLKEVFFQEEDEQQHSKYPPTAEEYAAQLNAQNPNSETQLSTDGWEDFGVYSGEDLAKYLAMESYYNAYKSYNGIRPRHVDLESLSIEQLNQMTDDLYRQMGEEDEAGEDASWASRGHGTPDLDAAMATPYDEPEDPQSGFSMHDDEFNPSDREREMEMWEKEQDSYAGGGRGFDS